MIEIRCMKDINILESKQILPHQLITMLREELKAIREWADEDHTSTMEDFNTDDYGYGYTAILEGNESKSDLDHLGLVCGLNGIIPETAENYYFEGDKWTRIIVIYNDSYTMVFWLKNCQKFDDYAA